MLLRIFLFVLSVFSVFLLPGLPAVLYWDQAAVAFFAAHRTELLTKIFWFITTLGGTWGFLVALLLPVIFFWRRQRRATALSYLVGVGLLKLSISLLKILVGRPRPPEAMIELATLSMPSGHGANAVMIYGVLAIYLLQKVHAPLWRAVLFLLCFGLIIMTDLSRVYLGVHYPSDVLMGSLCAAAGLWLLQGLREDLFLFNSQHP